VVYPADAELTEEEMILANAASESKEAEQTIQKAALVLRMREGIGSLARILKTIEVSSTMSCHVSHESMSVAKAPTLSYILYFSGYHLDSRLSYIT
jgi:tyrosine 3-monooxygenase